MEKNSNQTLSSINQEEMEVKSENGSTENLTNRKCLDEEKLKKLASMPVKKRLASFDDGNLSKEKKIKLSQEKYEPEQEEEKRESKNEHCGKELKIDEESKNDEICSSTELFNLSSMEGQKHLRDLNRELSILNEQGRGCSPQETVNVQSPQSSEEDLSLNRFLIIDDQSDEKMCSKNKDKNSIQNTAANRYNLRRKKSKEPKQKGVKRKRAISIPPDLLENLENEIDEVLEEKAWKNNLSAVNVKNILRYVITNEHVLAMVRNTMREEEDYSGNEENIEAAYEPKLTRSKAKELLEKQASIPWPISPIKKSQISCKLMEKEFSEDENSSDEEYKPEEDESDDESQISSQASEIGSPIASRLPLHDSVLQDHSNSSGDIKSLDKLTSPNEEKADELSNQVAAEFDTIALRTRSKLPLNDTPLGTIEASFVAPDITTDMYDSECDDEDWKNFLQEFVSSSEVDLNDTFDDEAEDPEYNFLEEEEEPDVEDLRDDRAVKISKKELSELMVELFEAAESELAECEDEEENVVGTEAPEFQKQNDSERAISLASADIAQTSKKKDKSNSILLSFTQEEKQQLDEQMRKHVQLLTQGYILSSSLPALKYTSETYKMLLIELQAFAIKNTMMNGKASAFTAYNLTDAISVISTFSINPNCQIPKKEKGCHAVLHPDAANTISKNKVFIYPELLPKCGFSECDTTKVVFSEAEDNLLALGLDQFLFLKHKYPFTRLIQENMLPTKTMKQIAIRIKNLKSYKSPNNNPVKYFFKNKKLPEIIRRIPVFDSSEVKAPVEQPLQELPIWLQKKLQPILPVSTPEAVRQPVLIVPKKPSGPSVMLFNSDLPATPTSKHSQSSESLHKNLEGLSPRAACIPIMTFSSGSSSSVGRTISVSSPLSNELTTVSVLNLRSATSCSNALLSPEKSKQLLLEPVLKTPEKSSPTLMKRSVSLRILPSPLKQVSPILKKYSPKRMRKTGGNLPILPKMFPRAIFVSPTKEKFCRPLAPKLPVSSPVKSLSPPVSSNTPEKEGTSEEQFGEESLTKISEDCETGELEMHSLVEQIGDNAILSPPVELDSQSDAEMFEDEEEPQDSAEDLAALMAASTTIQSTPRGRTHACISKKRSRHQRDLESTIALLSPDIIESDPLKEERELIFAQAYLMKAKEALKEDESSFEDLLSILYEFGQSNKTAVQLYRQICKLLKDFPSLCDEFLMFLLPEQAMECGKLKEYRQIMQMRLFLRKLEIHFIKHPQHLHKILRALLQCHTQAHLGITHIKSIMNPLFRGQAHLMEEFLQLFPNEQPPESHMTDFEEVTLPESDAEFDDDGFEIVTLPETEDEYGGKKCQCKCHTESQDPKLQNRIRHCIPCGTKFIDGRIYIQTGKVLKPAQVMYLNPEDKKNILAQQFVAQPSPHSDNFEGQEFEPFVNCTDPHSPCSESSSVSSLSPPILKDSEEEKEIVSEEKEFSTLHQTTNPLLEALEHISDEGPTRLPLPSDAVIENAILTPDTTKCGSTTPSDFSMLHKVLGKQDNKQDLDLTKSSKPCNKQVEQEVTSLHRNNIVESDRHSESDQNVKSTIASTSDETLPSLIHGTTESRNDSKIINKFSLTKGSEILPAPVLGDSWTNNNLIESNSKNNLVTVETETKLSRTTDMISEALFQSDLLNIANTEIVVASQLPSIASSENMVSQIPCTSASEPKETSSETPPRKEKNLDMKYSVSSPSIENMGLSAKNHSVDEKGEVVVLWTREADRLILQTFQQMGTTESALEYISKQLPSKSKLDISRRFVELINLFSEHQNGTDSEGSDHENISSV